MQKYLIFVRFSFLLPYRMYFSVSSHLDSGTEIQGSPVFVEKAELFGWRQHKGIQCFQFMLLLYFVALRHVVERAVLDERETEVVFCCACDYK